MLLYSLTSCEFVVSAISICQKTAAKLGNKYTVISQDLAVYEISYGLRKSQPEKFSNLVLLLGGFHKLMNYLKAVGSLMDGAGLKEVIVAAEILREGTANKVLSGKNMYQALHAHFQVYEGMNALWWEAFENWLETSCFVLVPSTVEKLRILSDAIERFKSETSSEAC